MANGFVVSSVMRAGSAFMRARSREGGHTTRAPRLQPTDDAPAHARHEALEAGRIVHDLGAVERRAQHGSLGDLAAIAAANAAIVDRRHRIVLQGVRGWLDGERGATGQTDAGVVAGADILVDAVALAHHASAALHRLGEQRLLTPLAIEH